VSTDWRCVQLPGGFLQLLGRLHRYRRAQPLINEREEFTVNRTRQPERRSGAAQQAVNSTAVTVGGIYLATHSVIVTVVGTAASTLLTAWALWLARSSGGAGHEAGAG
jgi:hypothetical protein